MQLSRQHIRSPLWFIIGVLALFVAIIGARSLVAAAQQPGMATVGSSEPWPRFTMVYRDTTEMGSGGPTVTQTFRVEYVDQRHFSTTLIAHSDPRVRSGYNHTFDGSVATTTDPTTGDSHSTTYGPNDFGVPADWLVPRAKPALLLKPGATSAIRDSETAIAHVSYATGGHQVIEEVRYRRADGIPLSFTQSVDGRLTRDVEVLQLVTGR